MGCLGFFVFWVRPLLTFKTQKFVVIQDWKLGLLLRCIELCVLMYVLWDIINKEGYLTTEVPQGQVSVLTKAGDNYTLERMREAFETAQHCTEPELYNFVFDDFLTYSDFNCVASELSGSSQKLENSIFIDTYFTENKLFTLPGRSEQNCRYRIGRSAPEESVYLGLLQGNCVYITQKHRFQSIPEEIQVTLSHGFSTSSAMGIEDVLPPCYLRDQSGKIIQEFKQGEMIEELVQQWLDWSELELDTSLDQQPIYLDGNAFVDDSLSRTNINITSALGLDANTSMPEDEKLYPRLRLTGVTLQIRMQYYNFRLSPIKNSISKDLKRNEKDFVCVMDIDPILSWTSAGAQPHYALRDFDDPRFLTNGDPPSENLTIGLLSTDIQRHGIKFTFLATGVIGKFSPSALIQSITSGLVLLALANTVVTMIALYACGLRSGLYREFILENVDWRQEYARFAAQAVVGAYVFNLMDSDASGYLNGVEIYAVLSRLFGHRMTEGQLAAVTDFVLKYGDDSSEQEIFKKFQGEKSTNISENQISIDEWMQIFSTNKASIQSMIRTIESEYKNQKPTVTKEMRSAQPILFGAIERPQMGASFHESKFEPEWKELELGKK
eukprot:TRINITY_DN2362_c0_g2_i2.p1 TRINITY_DN2362_c0_g2~~TRINITY_DN2362_c0_g2_i2.p1  ORF type:complete len:637 (+),score=57.93 TRINITY_DN2362_c0_g2_i2:82-1911(+)